MLLDYLSSILDTAWGRILAYVIVFAAIFVVVIMLLLWASNAHILLK